MTKALGEHGQVGRVRVGVSQSGYFTTSPHPTAAPDQGRFRALTKEEIKAPSFTAPSPSGRGFELPLQSALSGALNVLTT